MSHEIEASSSTSTVQAEFAGEKAKAAKWTKNDTLTAVGTSLLGLWGGAALVTTPHSPLYDKGPVFTGVSLAIAAACSIAAGVKFVSLDHRDKLAKIDRKIEIRIDDVERPAFIPPGVYRQHAH